MLIRFEIRIWIVAIDSIRDSIRTKISDSQVLITYCINDIATKPSIVD